VLHTASEEVVQAHAVVHHRITMGQGVQLQGEPLLVGQLDRLVGVLNIPLDGLLLLLRDARCMYSSIGTSCYGGG
jgi:hypothetical protein